MSMNEMHKARRIMVDNQIRTFDVTDQALLTAFEVVPREAFVGPADRAIAYADRPLTLGAGALARPLLPPLILARLLQALEPRPGDVALDVLGGAGYGAALLASMGLQVTLLETDPGHAETARKAAAEAGVTVTIAPAAGQLSAETVPSLPLASFDCILINGAVERDPKGLIALLREGGRLAVILRENGISRAYLYVKSGETTGRRRIVDVQAPILPGFALEPVFEF
jgi:protein-L-isoaspartate(D-aspartate) O-methyltransferase